ncbi:insulinase family protein [Bacillus sp. SL00103]
MDEFYTPDRVVISVAGNVDDTFISEVEKLFGSYETKGKNSS